MASQDFAYEFFQKTLYKCSFPEKTLLIFGLYIQTIFSALNEQQKLPQSERIHAHLQTISLHNA